MTIKKGSNRKVLVIGKYAVKFPTFYSMNLFLYGCYANWSERRYSRMMYGVDGNHFYDLVAPSIYCAWFGLFQIQRRIMQPIADADYYEPSFLDRFREVASDDFKPANFGYYEGRVVCCDYA